ncbi:MAG: hypothetical protein QOJ89_4873, partial [bacterium]
MTTRSVMPSLTGARVLAPIADLL